MAENLRAQLRQDFLRILRGQFEEKKAQIEFCNGGGSTSATVRAFDRETVQVLVAPFSTPATKESLPGAILRLTDIDTIRVECDTKK